MNRRIVPVVLLLASGAAPSPGATRAAPASAEAQVQAWAKELAFNESRAREAADRAAAFAASSGFLKDTSLRRKLAPAFKIWMQQHTADAAYAAWALDNGQDPEIGAKLGAGLRARGWAGEASAAGAAGALASEKNLEGWTEGFLRDLCQTSRPLAQARQGANQMWNQMLDWWNSLQKP